MSEIEEKLLALIAEAEDGDSMSALQAAILIHKNAAVAADLRISKSYESLLAAVLRSNDPEILSVAAEQMAIGRNLTGDRALLRRFLEKAERIDRRFPYYVGARLLQRSRSSAAYKAFRTAGRAGHIPSLVMARKMFLDKYWILRPLAWPIVTFLNFLSVQKALRAADIYPRFWRYKDLLPRETPALDAVMSVERKVSGAELTS